MTVAVDWVLKTNYLAPIWTVTVDWVLKPHYLAPFCCG